MIAEDQTMVRQALVALLELEPDIHVVAEAASGDEALAMARKHQPDVAVLDIEMPGPSGIEVARQLTALGFPGKIVIVTTFGRPGYLRAAMAAGASGFLLKDAPAAAARRGDQAGGGRRARGRLRARRGRADRGREPAEPARDRRAGRGGRARDHRRASPTGCTCRPAPSATTCQPRSSKLGARNRADAARIAQEKGWL